MEIKQLCRTLIFRKCISKLYNFGNITCFSLNRCFCSCLYVLEEQLLEVFGVGGFGLIIMLLHRVYKSMCHMLFFWTQIYVYVCFTFSALHSSGFFLPFYYF